MNVRTMLLILVPCSGVLAAGPVVIPSKAAVVDRDFYGAVPVIDRFVAHVGSADGVSEQARTFIREQWAARRDGDDAESFLVEALAVLSPAFKAGLDAYEDSAYEKAAAAMAPLTKNQDPYLAANAAVFELRSLVERTDLEAAHTRLTALGKDEASLRMHTLLAADVRFLTGYCQLHTLAYQAALETLESFEKDYPNAPERLRVTAKQIVQELKRRKPDGLGDVADLMAYAGRRLGIGVSGLAVVEKQVKAVALLDELIKQAEDKEGKGGECKKCGGKKGGCKACQGGAPNGNQASSSPANQSKLSGGGSQIGNLRARVARPGASWGTMPQAERDRILQAIKKNFPTRYRNLVEQYYKQLAKEQ